MGRGTNAAVHQRIGLRKEFAMAARTIRLGGVNRYGCSRKEVAPLGSGEPFLFWDGREGPGWAAALGFPIRKYSAFHIGAGHSQWVSRIPVRCDAHTCPTWLYAVQPVRKGAQNAVDYNNASRPRTPTAPTVRKSLRNRRFRISKRSVAER